MAVLLRYGSCLASVLIGVGFALALIDSRFGTRNLAILPNMSIAAIGIVLFILLPALRVLLMLLVFIREGDFRLAATAALVLTIILLSVVLGLRATSGISAYPSRHLVSVAKLDPGVTRRSISVATSEANFKNIAMGMKGDDPRT